MQLWGHPSGIITQSFLKSPSPHPFHKIKKKKLLGELCDNKISIESSRLRILICIESKWNFAVQPNSVKEHYN